MKKLIPMLAVAVLFSCVSLFVKATEEKTITGEGQCAKCSLKETTTCQNAVVVEEGGKEITYYVAQNDVSKKFHKNICQAPHKVKVTGEVKEEGGKQVITASKIELVEE